MEKVVTIILPIFNGASRIGNAIESVIAQSYKNWELLIIDDGSTDTTGAVVEQYIKKDSRISYIKNEHNLGIQKTLNRGVYAACGHYIARIDDDDIWIDTRKLELQVNFLNTNPNYVLVGTGVVAVDEQGNEVFKHHNPTTDKEIRKTILAKNCFLHSTVLFHKEAVLTVGGYDESHETRHVEDYDLWLKLGTVGKFANLPVYSVQLTLRIESLSSKNRVAQFKKSIRIIKKYKHVYPQYLFAVVSLWVRMMLYQFFQLKPFRSVYKTLYKIYKRI